MAQPLPDAHKHLQADGPIADQLAKALKGQPSEKIRRPEQQHNQQLQLPAAPDQIQPAWAKGDFDETPQSHGKQQNGQQTKMVPPCGLLRRHEQDVARNQQRDSQADGHERKPGRQGKAVAAPDKMRKKRIYPDNEEHGAKRQAENEIRYVMHAVYSQETELLKLVASMVWMPRLRGHVEIERTRQSGRPVKSIAFNALALRILGQYLYSL